MKKKQLLYAAAALVLAGCTSDEFVGTNLNQPTGSNEITFGSMTPNMTRAAGTATDAEKLNWNFTVYGIKGEVEDDAHTAFPKYKVWYTPNSANKTESNTNNWEYVGSQYQLNGTGTTYTLDPEQTIRYWDYSASQYDFQAWSITNGNATLESCTMAGLSFAAPTAKDLAGVYVANRVSAKATAQAAVAGTSPEYIAYQSTVQFTFRNIASKVRLGIYETVPGYTVSGVQFYIADGTGITDGQKNQNNDDYVMHANDAALYASSSIFGLSGTLNVAYNNDNVAVITTSLSSQSTYLDFGAFPQSVIGETSNTASLAAGDGAAGNNYCYAFPMESNTTDLNLKVNYTLTAPNGEIIHVTGANAVVPANYATWKANYAYTYIFKISDNTNGYTGDPSDPNAVAGLYPITFDACVVDAEVGNQETITTVADPSITTYQNGSEVLANNEYLESTKNIYLTVNGTDENNLAALSDANTKLFVVDNLGTEAVTEETVANMSNSIALIDISSELTYGKSIPGSEMMDGYEKTFSTTNNVLATFTPVAGYTYAFQYKDSSNKLHYKVIKVDGTKATINYSLYYGPSGLYINEGESKDLVVTANYNNGAVDKVVTGASGAFIISNNKLTVDETSAGTYTFTAQNGITSGSVDVYFNDYDVTYTVSAYAFTSGTTVATGSTTGTIELTLGGTAVTADPGVVIKNAAGTTATSSEIELTFDTTNKNYKINAKKAGTYTVSYLGASTTIVVKPWTLSFADKYVNKGNATQVTLANAAVATSDIDVALTASAGSATDLTTTDGVANVKPSDAGTLVLTYEDATASIIVKDFALKAYSDAACTTETTISPTGTYYVKLTESGNTVSNANFAVTGCTLAATSKPGIYKVTVTATGSITYKYQGVEMQKITW